MSNEQPSLRATRTAASHDARTVTPDERAGALEFLQGLSKEMAAGKVNLPCFPDVVVRIRRALANPQTHIAQTVRIVGTEPRLAARLLQTANSVIFNQSGKPVNLTIHQHEVDAMQAVVEGAGERKKRRRRRGPYRLSGRARLRRGTRFRGGKFRPNDSRDERLHVGFSRVERADIRPVAENRHAVRDAEDLVQPMRHVDDADHSPDRAAR